MQTDPDIYLRDPLHDRMVHNNKEEKKQELKKQVPLRSSKNKANLKKRIMDSSSSESEDDSPSDSDSSKTLSPPRDLKRKPVNSKALNSKIEAQSSKLKPKSSSVPRDLVTPSSSSMKK